MEKVNGYVVCFSWFVFVVFVMESIDRIIKDLYGNGQRGLIEQFIELKSEHKDMKENLKSLATSFSALARLDSNREAVRKALGKALIKASLTIGMFATIITLIIKLIP